MNISATVVLMWFLMFGLVMTVVFISLFAVLYWFLNRNKEDQ